MIKFLTTTAPMLRTAQSLIVLSCGISLYTITDRACGEEPSIAKDRRTALVNGADPKDGPEFQWLEKQIKEVARRQTRHVVGLRIGGAQGSGVVVSPQGLILTAAHVVGRPNQTAFIYLSDGRIGTGKTLGLHRATDSGMVQLETIQSKKLTKPLPHAEFRNTTSFVGQWCLAMGHPGGVRAGRGPTLRIGRILNKDTNVTTNCTLISGDSGGPLFDLQGQLVAIHSRIGVDLNNNIHLPISAVLPLWERLSKGEVWGEPTTRPFLGVKGRGDQQPPTVEYVFPDSPAQATGLKVGDEIISLGTTGLKDFNQLVQVIGKHRPGDRVWIVIRRRGRRMRLQGFIGGIPAGTFKQRREKP